MRLQLSGLKISFDRDGKVQLTPPDFSLSLDLFAYWLKIGFTHLIQAENAHRDLLVVWEQGDNPERDQWLEKEFSASLQCVIAAAIAIDSFYAMVRNHVQIPRGDIEAWRTNRTRRPKYIAEVFKRGFLIGPKSFATMREQLVELFKWRDWATHPPARFDKPVPYDELRVGTEWRFVAFRFDNAKKSLALSLSVIAQLLLRPKSDLQSLAEHCQGSLPLINPLVTQWESKYGQLYERKTLGGQCAPPTEE